MFTNSIELTQAHLHIHVNLKGGQYCDIVILSRQNNINKQKKHLFHLLSSFWSHLY